MFPSNQLSHSQFPINDSMTSMSPSTPPQMMGMNVVGNTASPFLPGYLLGDNQIHPHASSPKIWSNPGSPAHKSGLGGTTPALSRRESARKVGGPPIKSLYSSSVTNEVAMSQSQLGRPHSSPSLRQMPSSPAPPTTGILFQTPGKADQSILNQSQNLPVSPAQADPFYTQGDLKSDDLLDDTWVTVFGFAPGATSFILQQFSQYGTILKHVVVPECNWMHIHYQSRIQAKKALSKDGKIYGGCMKIGVSPCIEKNVMENKENQSLMDVLNSTDAGNTSSLTPIRPLTAAYVAARGEYEVLQDKQTPKRDSGIVTKLKEYMFGY